MSTLISQTKNPALFNHDIREDVICLFLDIKALFSLGKCCRAWKDSIDPLIEQQLKNYLNKEGFGASKWEQYVGAVEKVPLPLKLWEILNSPCPFWPKKKVRDTHILFLLPKNVNGNPLTLNMMEEVGKQFSIGVSYLRDFSEETAGEDREKLGDITTDKSCWVLMTKSNIPKSRNKNYDEQRKLLPSSGLYKHPNVIEAATGIFITYVLHRKWPYPAYEACPDPFFPKKNTATTCEEWQSRSFMQSGYRYAVGLEEGVCGCRFNDPRKLHIVISYAEDWLGSAHVAFKPVQVFGPDSNDSKICTIS